MNTVFNLELVPGQLTLAQCRSIFKNPTKIHLSEKFNAPIERAVACVNEIVSKEKTTYGINTGFGLLAQTRIANKDLSKLQQSLVLSHSTGVGEALEDDVVRLIMVLKINSLARGFSGISRQVIDALIALVNHQVYPMIPAKGSVGASGDLAPLAHMSALLLGEGSARYNGQWLNAQDALKIAGLETLSLGPKEGLALLNGTQVSTAYALKGLFLTEELYATACVCGSLSVEASMGSRTPFDARIHEVRGQKGQIDAAFVYRYLLDEASEISLEHSECDKVQDPYSLRCQPQVMGACLDQIRFAANILHIEANAVSDNPLVFAEQEDILSGGNFHAEPIAMVADNLALVIAEIANLSERRVALLMDKHLSQLPSFLVNDGGVNSGFMIAQVTSAALASENKALSHPHSVDTIPTSANQEDHVSMAPAAGRRLWEMAENTRYLLGIEWLASCQGIDFRNNKKTSSRLEKARNKLRESVRFYDKDRFFAPDIEKASTLIKQNIFWELMPANILPSQE
ncbi:histidine ammonia-lyase [Thorsellia kenyensis]|uniref:Histidine ammonia-lyase n=1 Tax=Thorsellia kenyensis TaxID=1549888 RepID=A0ABV6CDJ9_9GAMM